MPRARSNPFVNYDEKVYTTFENDDDDDIIEDNTPIANEKLIKRATEKPLAANYLYVNDKIFARVWFVATLAITIMCILTMGIVNLYQATEIIYGTIGFYAFYAYYIIHVGWYAIFLIIHLFLGATQLFYTMNQTNYISHIILNYGHIWYINFIKLLFGCALVAILYMNSDIATIGSSCIPLYYNLMLIETIASSLLISMTNEIVININTIKLVQETSLV